MQNICYHVAEFMIPFNDHVLKNLTFDLLNRSGAWGGGGGGVCGQDICYHVVPFNLICNMTMF